MKNLYIKFKEGDEESLQRAVQEAERLGYKRWNRDSALTFNWTGILQMDSRGVYFITVFREDELTECHYKEHKMEPQFEEGDIIEVYKGAEQERVERIFIEKDKNDNFLVVASWKDTKNYHKGDGYYGVDVYNEARPIEKITIKTEEGEEMEISKEKAKDLWFKLSD